MKRCPQCATQKPRAEFYQNRSQSDGLTTQCKVCCKANAAARREAKPEVTRAETKAAWATRGRQYTLNRREAKQRYLAENATQIAAQQSDYRKANLSNGAANTARHRAAKHLATPSWANHRYIALFYEMAKLEAQRVGKPVEVDHIVPLQSPLVCGLHCEHNLQLLFRSANRSKANRVWPDMPTQHQE